MIDISLLQKIIFYFAIVIWPLLLIIWSIHGLKLRYFSFPASDLGNISYRGKDAKIPNLLGMIFGSLMLLIIFYFWIFKRYMILEKNIFILIYIGIVGGFWAISIYCVYWFRKLRGKK